MKTLLPLIILVVSLVPAGAEVSNPDRPQLGEWDLRAEKAWDVSAYGRQPAARPHLAAVLECGRIVIYDYKLKCNFLLDENGIFVRAFGRKGDGPGEVKSQQRVFSFKETIIVEDFQKLHYFGRDGSYRETVPFDRGKGRPLVFLATLQYLSCQENPGESIRFFLVDLASGKSRLLFQQEEHRKQDYLKTRGRITIVIPPLTPTIKSAYDNDSRLLYFGINSEYRIAGFDLEGNPGVSFSLQRSAREISTAQKKKINKEMPLSRQAWNALGKSLVLFDKIVACNGLLYVVQSDFEDLHPCLEVDIFSGKGQYLYRSSFCPGPGELVQTVMDHGPILRKDFLYVVIQDSEGEMKICKYGIVLPPDNRY